MRILRNVIGMLGLVMIIVSVVVWAGVRYANPAMTETQLVIAFWWLNIPVLVGLVMLWFSAGD